MLRTYKNTVKQLKWKTWNTLRL